MVTLVGGYALEAMHWLASVITIVACALYFRAVRSRPGLWILVGASGGLATSIASWGTSLALTWQMLHPGRESNAALGALSVLGNRIAAGLTVLGFVFAMLFSVSLLLILRDAVAARRSAEFGAGGSTTPDVEAGAPA